MAIGLAGFTIALVPVTAAGAAGDPAVTISASCGGAEFCFTPSTLTIADGDTVTWTNTSGTDHFVGRCDPASCDGTSGGKLALTKSGGGVLVLSVPNVAFLPQRIMLLFGQFNYGRAGILDRTHLRFFTRESIVTMFEDAGFEILALDPINPKKRGRWAATNRFLRGRLDDLLALQFAVVGRPCT